VCTAERSYKAAIEDQQNIATAKIGEAHDLASEVGQDKIRRGGIDGYFRHVHFSFGQVESIFAPGAPANAALSAVQQILDVGTQGPQQ